MSAQRTAFEVCLASSNAGKVRECLRVFHDLPLRFIPQGDLGIDAAEETGRSFAENALLKARHASASSGLPALSDDSGLCVPALGMRPGLHSARFAPGSDLARASRLLEAMEGLGGHDRRAFFWCAAALIRGPDDPTPMLSQAAWHGMILEEPRGDGGFGYDPIFLGHGCSGRSAAELGDAEKDRRSHRGKALRGLRRQMRLQWDRLDFPGADLATDLAPDLARAAACRP
jgi:XTP/dITP diphosphohydrolase